MMMFSLLVRWAEPGRSGGPITVQLQQRHDARIHLLVQGVIGVVSVVSVVSVHRRTQRDASVAGIGLLDRMLGRYLAVARRWRRPDADAALPDVSGRSGCTVAADASGHPHQSVGQRPILVDADAYQR